MVSEEKIKMWKVNGRQTTDNGRRTPSDGKSSHCLWQGELKRVHSTRIRKWKVYQLLAHGRWFSPGTPASSTTKTGRHDIAESGIKHNKSNKIICFWVETNLCRFLLLFVYICCWMSNYQRKSIEIPLISLTTTTFLCLSQASTLISNIIYCGIFCFPWF